MTTKKGMKKTLRDRKGRFRKSHWSPLKKQLPAWVIIVVFMLMIPTVYALATVVIPAGNWYNSSHLPSRKRFWFNIHSDVS